MNSLISINNKFMVISPSELVGMIKNSKHTKGVEIFVDVNSQAELDYLDALVPELKANNLIMQVHGESELPYDKQLDFLGKLGRYADYLGQKITVTLHPLNDPDRETSKAKTIEFMKTLVQDVDHSKLTICLENLNSSAQHRRIGREYVVPIIENTENLYFTYDMGHEMIDKNNIIFVDDSLIDIIRNIHFHTNTGPGTSHAPIYENDMNWAELLKGIQFLSRNNYKYNIVYEYDLYDCQGNTVKEQIADYLDSIDFVSENYDK